MRSVIYLVYDILCSVKSESYCCFYHEPTSTTSSVNIAFSSTSFYWQRYTLPYFSFWFFYCFIFSQKVCLIFRFRPFFVVARNDMQGTVRISQPVKLPWSRFTPSFSFSDVHLSCSTSVSYQISRCAVLKISSGMACQFIF